MAEPAGEVGPALPAADAAFLRHELAQRGIEARLREVGPRDMVVEVAREDLERAVRLRDEILGGEAAARTSRPAPDGRRKALLAAAVGSVAVLYVGRGLGPGLRVPLALAAGLAAYLLAIFPHR